MSTAQPIFPEKKSKTQAAVSRKRKLDPEADSIAPPKIKKPKFVPVHRLGVPRADYAWDHDKVKSAVQIALAFSNWLGPYPEDAWFHEVGQGDFEEAEKKLNDVGLSLNKVGGSGNYVSHDIVPIDKWRYKPTIYITIAKDDDEDPEKLKMAIYKVLPKERPFDRSIVNDDDLCPPIYRIEACWEELELLNAVGIGADSDIQLGGIQTYCAYALDEDDTRYSRTPLFSSAATWRASSAAAERAFETTLRFKIREDEQGSEIISVQTVKGNSDSARRALDAMAQHNDKFSGLLDLPKGLSVGFADELFDACFPWLSESTRQGSHTVTTVTLTFWGGGLDRDGALALLYSPLEEHQDILLALADNDGDFFMPEMDDQDMIDFMKEHWELSSFPAEFSWKKFENAVELNENKKWENWLNWLDTRGKNYIYVDWKYCEKLAY